jgi:hypothetical protein
MQHDSQEYLRDLTVALSDKVEAREYYLETEGEAWPGADDEIEALYHELADLHDRLCVAEKSIPARERAPSMHAMDLGPTMEQEDFLRF